MENFKTPEQINTLEILKKGLLDEIDKIKLDKLKEIQGKMGYKEAGQEMDEENIIRKSLKEIISLTDNFSEMEKIQRIIGLTKGERE